MDLTIRTFRRWLDEADRVLVAAGAGLSAAAGYDYTDTRRFAELFPALYRQGLRARYQLIGLPLPPQLLWGYWAVHVDDIRFGPGPNPVYQRLRELVGDRDHFVVTSNVDGLFERNGFAPDRVWTPQGDYARYQCEIPCTGSTWESRPIIDTALASYDPGTGTVLDEAVPHCPHCGGDVFLNVHKGPEFIDDHYVPTARRLSRWLDTPSRLLVIEIGAGMNTPTVIRRPTETITRHSPTTRLVRINPEYPDVPTDLAERALSIAAGVEDVLEAMT
ncbi:hypothetical protein [Kutzneria sp. CA-103260]|uniref:hypothetical protein n=1 Tax=Kutzneria sp. CA-103260 TaxID=2802641 RepID=UPI001BA6FA69|nr:hypothetical protein [Kutzneria sp. CA-103260]QUQ63490.1 SIR2 family NAD-dependent deacetylase [Kutzneria sp. CA-103260]